MTINTKDISYSWGEKVNELERENGRWRHALFQDVQESFDTKMLYFLYDPIADEKCETTGRHRKGYAGLTIFDTESRCFSGQVPLPHPGSLKFLFSLKCPSPQGGSSLILVTEEFNMVRGHNELQIYRLDMWADGRQVAESRTLLFEPIPISGDYICSLREDAPEIVVLTSPGMQVYRVDCMATTPTRPAYYAVSVAELNQFYDGFLNNGKVCLLSAHPDGYLDWSRAHILDLNNPYCIVTFMCSPDPTTNSFPTPRKQCAIDSFKKGIVFAGGEIDSGEEFGNIMRLRDYWILDLNTFQWKMLADEMPCDLIEPRLTVANSGNIYLWGDYDIPVKNIMPEDGAHIRIFQITGIQEAEPYYSSMQPSVEGNEKNMNYGDGCALYSDERRNKNNSIQSSPLRDECNNTIYGNPMVIEGKKKKGCCLIM